MSTCILLTDLWIYVSRTSGRTWGVPGEGMQCCCVNSSLCFIRREELTCRLLPVLLETEGRADCGLTLLIALTPGSDLITMWARPPPGVFYLIALKLQGVLNEYTPCINIHFPLLIRYLATECMFFPVIFHLYKAKQTGNTRGEERCVTCNKFPCWCTYRVRILITRPQDGPHHMLIPGV